MSFFLSSLTSCSISLTSHRLTEWTELTHSRTGEKGGTIPLCKWLLWALSPVPQPPFLTKTWQTLSLQGTKGRVILYNSYCAPSVRYSAVGSYMLVLTVLFFNHELQGVKTTVFPPPLFWKEKSFACLFRAIWANAVSRRVFIFLIAVVERAHSWSFPCKGSRCPRPRCCVCEVDPWLHIVAICRRLRKLPWCKCHAHLCSALPSRGQGAVLVCLGSRRADLIGLCCSGHACDLLT